MDHSNDQQLLEQYLIERDEACPCCGYNLRALHGSKCLECGDALRLHVGLVEPKRAAFLTGLIGLSAGGGFSGLLCLYACYHIILMGRGGGPKLTDLWILLFEAVVSAILAAVWIRHANQFRRLRRNTQWTFAVLCCFLAPVSLCVFIAFVV